jgi:hypothetical protein
MWCVYVSKKQIQKHFPLHTHLFAEMNVETGFLLDKYTFHIFGTAYDWFMIDSKMFYILMINDTYFVLIYNKNLNFYCCISLSKLLFHDEQWRWRSTNYLVTVTIYHKHACKRTFISQPHDLFCGLSLCG